MSEAPPGFFDDDDQRTSVVATSCNATSRDERLSELESNNVHRNEDVGADDVVARRVAQWKKANVAAFGVRKEYREATRHKDPVPPEYLRRVLKEQGALKGKKYREERRLLLGGMEYMPLALAKLVETIPMPWEVTRYVNVVQHATGAITLVDDTPTVSEPIYTAQWASVWQAMRRKKALLRRENTVFRRVKFPVFDENEPPIDYVDHLMDRDGELPLTDDALSPADDACVIDWFYDQEPQLVSPSLLGRPPKKGQWFFGVEVMENLFRIATPILPDYQDDNRFYLWDLASFYTAKAMHVAVPRAPKFDLLRRRGKAGERIQAEEDDDWTEFNDLRRIIHRDDPKKPKFTMLTERQIAFPYLYSRTIDGVEQGVYHHPAHIVVPDDGILDTPCFIFDPSLNPIRPVERLVRDVDIVGSEDRLMTTTDLFYGDDCYYDDDVPLVIPRHSDRPFQPFLSDLPLEVPETKAAIALSFAPPPFNTFSGTVRRRVDIAVAESYYETPVTLLDNEMPEKIARSYTQLLKHHVLKRHEHDRQRGKTGSTLRKIDILAEKPHFQRSNVEWLEAALQVLRQGHEMLVQLMNMKGLSYVHIDYNFNAKPTKTLTTKEIKRSRLGPAFHLLREMLAFTKHLVDVHVQFRLGQIDAYQLADAVHYVFTHVGKLTGLYRYKYRAMRQIKRARDLKHVLYHRFNVGEVPPGPGMGFWAPSWRVWVFYLRGMAPLMQRYLGNLVNRMFEGRKHKVTVKKITKQRIEADKDVNIKDDFRRELVEMLPDNARAGVIKTLDQHLNEAFRCWKANLPWSPPGLAPLLKQVIDKYTKLRAEEYIRYAHAQRKRIDEGLTVDKQAFMKNLGRLTRLKVMEEAKRQKDFITGAEPFPLDKHDAVIVYQTMAAWLKDRGFKQIPFPKASHAAALDLLKLSLNRLRLQHNIANRVTQEQREEQKRIEEAFDAPYECLTRIRDALSRQRHFKTIQVGYMDGFSHLYPIYKIDPSEKMNDSFLDQYLWYEAMDQQRLFPNWVKPADTEPLPILVHKWCQGINNCPDIWSTSNGESVVMLKLDMGTELYDNVNWTLFRSLLELIMDPVLVEYIVARHTVRIEYKDMGYSHVKGLIRGVLFSGFLAQYWGLVQDVLLLGTRRSQDLAGPPSRPNPFLSFARDPHLATTHPIRGYSRYNSTAHILLRFSKAEADELRQRYITETADDPVVAATHRSIHGFTNFKNWPRDCRMRLFLSDVNLARAVMWDFQSRIPQSFVNIRSESCMASVYSRENPNLLFDLAGFSIRILPVCRTTETILESESMWPLHNESTRDMTARAFVQVSPQDVAHIKNRIRRCIMAVGSSTFQNIATKWNAVLTEIVPYYREAILGTDGLQEILAYGEKRMQTRIMMALNSKMASRFPPVMFYAPADMGGLDMLSIGHSMIPAKDTLYSKKTSTGVQYFMSGLTNIDDKPIPNILHVYPPWETEVAEHVKATQEFAEKLKESKIHGTRISLDDLQGIMDKGIPRIRVHFSKDAKLFKCDKGFRVRLEFQKYALGKPNKNWWFSADHDGRLCSGLDKYRADMTIALGGVEAVLEHSLFRGTGFPSWEGLDWNRNNSFENSKRDANITKAMRGGLTTIPNRRFALWWSPTINRSDVYAGAERQLDLTGVFMNGKLETIKKSLIKLFANGFWANIHKSITEALASGLHQGDRRLELDIDTVTKPSNHPNKSFTFSSSAADILLHANTHWVVGNAPTLLTDANDVFQQRVTKKWWIDIQLRWGNFDSHNIAEYARSKYHEYTRDGRTQYPSPAGVVVAVDLAYNIFSAYGLWIRTDGNKMKKSVMDLMGAILQNDSIMASLRLKLRSELQLRSSQPTEQNISTTNISELFATSSRAWIVDDSHAYVTSEQPTAEGSKKYKSENGAVLVFEPNSGALRCSIIHKSVFVGHKRRTKLAKEKAAEEIVTWLRSTPPSEHPTEMIVTRPKFRAVLQNMLLDYVNIKVRAMDLALALPAILQHSRLADLRINATESRVFKFNAYDDWLHTFQPVTCFMMLNLILRGYHVNLQRTREMLEPDTYVEKREGHFWPTYTKDEWKRRSTHLQELIIADYCRRNRITPSQLLSTEIQDIIMGKKMTTQEIQEEEAKEIEEKHKAALATKEAEDPSAAKTVTAVNKRGEVVKRRVKAAFSVGSTTSVNDWRPRCVANATLHQRAKQLDIVSEHATAQSKMLVFSRDALLRLVEICDVHMEMVVYMFGQQVPQTPLVHEVVALMIPPQFGGLYDCQTPEMFPYSDELLVRSNLTLLGMIRIGGGLAVIHSKDLALLGRALECNEGLEESLQSATGTVSLSIAVVGLHDGTLTMECHTATDLGLRAAREHHARVLKPDQEPVEVEAAHIDACRATVSEKLQSFFLLPAAAGGSAAAGWNTVFNGRTTWKQQDVFAVVPAQPEEYFAAQHRPEHFRSFARLYDSTTLRVDDDELDIADETGNTYS